MTDTGELTVAVFSKKEYNGVTVPEVDLQDGHWVSVIFILFNETLLDVP